MRWSSGTGTDGDVKKIKETCDRWGVKVTAFSGQKPFSLCDGENSAGYIEWMKRSIDAAKYLNCDTLIAFPIISPTERARISEENTAVRRRWPIWCGR